MEQKQKGKLDNYFKIIGIIILISHTFIMGIEVLYGIVLAFGLFIKGIFLIIFDQFKLQCLVLLVIWVLIFKYLKSRDLRSIQKMFFDRNDSQNEMSCELCKKKACNKIYYACLHAFHQECQKKKYQDPNKIIDCPICNEDSNMQVAYALKRVLKQVYKENTFFAKVVLFSSVIFGIYRFYFAL